MSVSVSHCGMHWFETRHAPGGGVALRGVTWTFETPDQDSGAVLAALERAGLLLTARFRRGGMVWWHGNAVPGLYPVTVIWWPRAVSSQTILIVWGPPSGDGERDARNIAKIIATAAYHLGAYPVQHAPGADEPEVGVELAVRTAYEDLISEV